MTRLAGVDLQDSWKVDYALTRIKGMGWALSKKILKLLDFPTTKRVSDLSSEELAKLANKLEKYSIEGDLLRQVRANVQRLKTIGAYRGVRHARNLPTRGQRTRSNARTKRGKRRTVGALKKEILSKLTQQKTEKEA